MREPTVVPIAEYLPDQPDNIGSDNILNVYPRTQSSYGRILTGQRVNNGLAEQPVGAAAFRYDNANWHIFAGTASGANGKIYSAEIPDISTLTWTDVSKFGGYSTASAITNEYGWKFADFNGNIVATNGVDAIQTIVNDGGTAFADLSVDAPIARYIAVVQNAFLVAGNTSLAAGLSPTRQRVHWSAAGDHTSWPAIGTSAAAAVQSGAADLLGDEGVVQGFAVGLTNAAAVVFQEFAVKRMEYVGPPSIFSFLPVENARGCRAPRSIVTVGGTVYYWGQDGIYAFDGIQSKPIGATKVNRTVYTDCNSFNAVFGAADPDHNLVLWAYPSVSADAGTTNKVLIYNYVLGRFSLAEITTSYAGIIRITDLSGDPAIAYFAQDTTYFVYYFTGDGMAATVETQDLQPQPGKRWFVSNVRPLIDADSSATVSVQMGRRDKTGDTLSYPEAAVARNSLGMCPQRISGRYMRAKLTVAADDSWGHIAGVEMTAAPQGGR